MTFITSRRLEKCPVDLTTIANNVILLTSREDASFLEAYDARLTPVWSKRLDSTAIALRPIDGILWVLDSEGASACGDGGPSLAGITALPRKGMRVSAFGPVDDGFVFACEHDAQTAMGPPILKRVNYDGTTRWSTRLPIGTVEYKGVVQFGANTGWKPQTKSAWIPRTWVSNSPTLAVSGDAVLACFSEMPESGIGCGYVVGLADGALRFTTERGPISEVAPLGKGAFLVGYQGYGTFETLRYEGDGRVLDRWPSHGLYVIGDGVRVVELENTKPSRMHLVRLLPGGAVKQGAWLNGYYTSRPLLGADGTVYFFRNGEVLAARELSIKQRLALTALDDVSFSTAIAGDEQGFYFAYQGAGTAGSTLVRIAL